MTQRRYESESEIVREIDRVLAIQRQQENERPSAFHEERQLQEKRRMNTEGRLVKLKRKLAEFRTPKLPALDNHDQSIPVSDNPAKRDPSDIQRQYRKAIEGARGGM